MNIAKRSAAVLAAVLCIATTPAYLTQKATAQETENWWGDTEISETVAWGRAAEDRRLSSIKSCLYYSDNIESDDIVIPVLKKSRTIKNHFVMSANDKLIIPSGKTLTLTGGAYLDGTIYIEEGGMLLIDKYSTYVDGKIICFGTIGVTNGTFSCCDNSLLYVAKGGELLEAGDFTHEIDGKIGATEGANVVCLGHCNIPDPTFSAEPVAAAYCDWGFGGNAKEVSTITNKDKLSKLLDVKCNTSAEFFDDDFADVYTILFSGGGCVTYTANGDTSYGWTNIGGVYVQVMNKYLTDYHRVYS